MGTRADFYVGRGSQAEWLGSISFDGYPDGQPNNPEWGVVTGATTEAEFRERVERMLAGCGSSTRPAQGWPWPWPDSGTTDYAYAFDSGAVWTSCFGGPWFKPTDTQERPERDGSKAEFPDMTARQKVTLGERSGLIVVAARGLEKLN